MKGRGSSARSSDGQPSRGPGLRSEELRRGGPGLRSEELRRGGPGLRLEELRRGGEIYRDRREAGEILAAAVCEQVGCAVDATVLALPRGGVPVGLEVARELGAALDVFVVRKLGAPGQEEYAIGAIAAGGYEVLNEAAIAELGIAEKEIAAIAEREAMELRRREEEFRGSRPSAKIAERDVILVDDGLATGFTMRAAVAAVRARLPRRLIVAVPVGAGETCRALAREVDALVCPLQPEHFVAVGQWYRDFTQTTDLEVRELLATAEHAAHR